jgi:hypothetical protein
MWKQLGLWLVASAVAACGGQAATVPAPSAATSAREPAHQESASDAEGRRYLAALVAAIDSAERIVVSEHSFKYDAPDDKGEEVLRANPIVYGTQELSQEQRAAFKATISKLDPATPEAFAACIFEPHHTVTFFRSNEEPSAMLICFECGDVRWKSTSSTAPESLIGGLGELVESVGLEPFRDWRALAREHLKK